jgi:hypothetical protein
MRKLLVWIPAAALALFAGSSSTAAEDARFIPAKRPAKAGASAAAAAPQAEVRVISIPLEECPADDNEAMTAVKAFLDPATGELRAPTPEDEAALARAIGPRSRRTEAARTPMALPNGLVAIEVGEDSMMDVVVRTGADGKPVFSCTSRDETPKALTRPLPAAKANSTNEEK